jgi:hypothetical protein
VPDYSAARAVAPRIHAHFAHHSTLAESAGANAESAGANAENAGANAPRAALPDIETIEAIVDAAFWASLRREEGYVPKISLALVPRELAGHPLIFEKSLPLSTTALVRVAPAVERPGIHLGVWREAGELRVWGATRTIPAQTFVLEVAAPGLLVIKNHRGDAGKYVNVAVLEGDLVKVIDEKTTSRPECPSLVTSLVATGAAGASDAPNVLVQLAVSMRAHARGGSMLVVPQGSDAWLECIVRPVRYSISPNYAKLADLVRRADTDGERRAWRDALEDAVSAVAGLTAVDGATVITDRYELLAFGAKIARRRGSPQVEQVLLTEPIEGSAPEVLHPTRLGGTRHLSAAQFVQDEHSAIALVASQDGRFTIFAWSACEKMVHAHRVEALLL